MRCVLFISSLLFLSASSLAGNKIDSLQAELLIHDSEDALKVDILNQLGYEYWIVNPIQSIIYGQQAKALSTVINYEKGTAFSNRVIGVGHWAKGSYDDGLKYLSESQSQYQLLNDSLGLGNTLMNMGLIYSDRSDFERATSFFFDALRIFEKLNVNGRAATTYTKIATIFIKQGNDNAAKDFLERAIQIHKSNEFDYGLSEAYNRKGVLMFEMESYDSAYFYLKMSYMISDEINDYEGKTKTFIDLSRIEIDLGEFDRAESHLQAALSLGKEIGSLKWLKEIYENLNVIYRNRGDLERALFYLDQYVQVKDSIFNEQTINNISRLETELATAEQKRQLGSRENEIVILQQESDLQKAKITILLVVVCAVFGVAFLLLRVRQKSAKIREEQALKEALNAKQQLEYKNRELMSYTVNFVQKNQLFEELISSIQKIKKKPSEDIKSDLLGVERIVKRHLQVDRDWEDFKLRFENLHSGFFDKLLSRNSSLTNNDLKLSVLVKMNFSIKEIADMMGISAESVKTSRYRLKKKLSLPQEQNLNDFLNGLA
ncbi:MAG: tetratricopeptide repeat protein [Ekhidna sp.]